MRDTVVAPGCLIGGEFTPFTPTNAVDAGRGGSASQMRRIVGAVRLILILNF